MDHSEMFTNKLLASCFTRIIIKIIIIKIKFRNILFFDLRGFKLYPQIYASNICGIYRYKLHLHLCKPNSAKFYNE